MTERRVGGTEAAEMLQKAAETLAVGDRIELRWTKPFSLDDAGGHPAEPEYTWEPIEIIEIIPKAPTASLATFWSWRGMRMAQQARSP